MLCLLHFRFIWRFCSTAITVEFIRSVMVEWQGKDTDNLFPYEVSNIVFEMFPPLFPNFFVSRIREFFRIFNVKTLKFEIANVDYSSSHDHSKWAITDTTKSIKHWVCIGDINRAVNILLSILILTLKCLRLHGVEDIFFCLEYAVFPRWWSCMLQGTALVE